MNSRILEAVIQHGLEEWSKAMIDDIHGFCASYMKVVKTFELRKHINKGFSQVIIQMHGVST